MMTTLSNQNTQWLFTYGTLRDPEIQQILFGKRCRSQAARLPDWTLCAADEDGYLFIRPDPAGAVCGEIIAVDDAMLMIADRWEEVPRYLRERVVVDLEDGASREVWTYTRRDGGGKIYTGTRTSLLDRQAVLDEAALFTKSIS